jgi:hypothetical protein
VDFSMLSDPILLPLSGNALAMDPTFLTGMSGAIAEDQDLFTLRGGREPSASIASLSPTPSFSSVSTSKSQMPQHSPLSQQLALQQVDYSLDQPSHGLFDDICVPNRGGSIDIQRVEDGTYSLLLKC